MHMKQKVIEILGAFLKRNEGYVVYAYLKNLAGKILVNYSMHEWNVEENDEYGQRSIHILFLNGLQLEFECCGECVEK